jgi:serine protease Do
MFLSRGLMRKIFQLFVMLAITIPAYAVGIPETFAPVVEKTSSAVVNISTKQTLQTRDPRRSFPDNPLDLFEFFEREFGLPMNRPRVAQSLGSGFVIDPEGYVVTNYHVVDDADEIEITFGSSETKTYQAKIIGKDKMTDLALLKIDAKQRFPYVVWGNSDEAKVGDWIVANGNPFGLGSTVTAGIISAKARYINGTFDDYIQTDASVNKGNSGGPMFNMKGEVIGVNTAIFSTSGGGSIGIGFAIPSQVAKPVIEQLKTAGKVERPWLGVVVQQVTDEMVQGLGLGAATGALVSEVAKGSPADKAGIRVGDVIIRFDGKEVTSSQKLPLMVMQLAINRKVGVEIIRDGKSKVVYAQLSKREDSSETTPEISSVATDVLGITVQDINEENRHKFELDEKAKGVVITGIQRGSPMRMVGVQMGDRILRLNQQKIEDIKEFSEVLSQLKKQGAKNVVMLMSRGNSNATRFVAVRIN